MRTRPEHRFLVRASGLIAWALACVADPSSGTADAEKGGGVVAALRAKGAEVLPLGALGGLDGYMVTLTDGEVYSLYVTADGHAVAGLLYGPDGALITGAANGGGWYGRGTARRPNETGAGWESVRFRRGWRGALPARARCVWIHDCGARRWRVSAPRRYRAVASQGCAGGSAGRRGGAPRGGNRVWSGPGAGVVCRNAAGDDRGRPRPHRGQQPGLCHVGRERGAVGGLLATAGGLVFAGNLEGSFLAIDAQTLQELWRFDIGAGITAPPMTFAAGGKQYVAIEVGYGGAAEQWQNDIFPEMWLSNTANVLYVFSL